MKKIRKKLHLSDEGFSLMELIVTMLVSAVVTAAAAGFLVAGVQFYNRANAEANLQKESQVAELFLTELIQEAVDYQEIDSAYYPSDVRYALRIMRRDASGNDEYAVVVWMDRELRYGVVSNTITNDADRVAAVADGEKYNTFLAACVENFSVSPGKKSDADANGLVLLTLSFEEANKTYNGSATISLRNKKKN